MIRFVDDNALFVAFHRGDETAVRQLYDRFYKPLCWFAEKILHNKADAEDIALDSFIKLLKKKTDFDNLGELQSFLYTATRNSCYNFIRDSRRHAAAHEQLSALVEKEVPLYEDEELMARVLTIIYAEMDRLPGQCQKVFKAIFLEGKKTEQVAAELGISTQTVLNQKSRALQHIRLTLIDKGLYSTGIFLHCVLLLSVASQA